MRACVQSILWTQNAHKHTCEGPGALKLAGNRRRVWIWGLSIKKDQLRLWYRSLTAGDTNMEDTSIHVCVFSFLSPNSLSLLFLSSCAYKQINMSWNTPNASFIPCTCTRLSLNIDSLLVMDGSKSSLNRAFISPVALWECAIVLCVHVWAEALCTLMAQCGWYNWMFVCVLLWTLVCWFLGLN